MRIHGWKVSALIAAAAALLIGACAHNGHGGYDYARVVSVEPLYEAYGAPAEREVCWQERAGYRRTRAEPSVAPVILAAIIGGILGNQITKGSHWNTRDNATFAGAMLGGAVAYDAQTHAHRTGVYHPGGERCAVQRDGGAEAGYWYDVIYEYRGREYLTRTDYDPGDFIRVRYDGAPVL